MQFLSNTRGASTTVTYTLITVVVIATAGGGVAAVQELQGVSESQIESQQFTAEYFFDFGSHYRLVYTGSEVLTHENTDVLEVSGDDKQILMTPDDWSGNNLSRGDIVIEDLTPNAIRNSEFNYGENLNIIKYSNAEINNGSIVGAEQAQLVGTVTVGDPQVGGLEAGLYDEPDVGEDEGDDDNPVIIE